MTASFLISLLLSYLPVQDTLLQAASVTAVKEGIPLEYVASPVSSFREERLSRTGTFRPNSLSALVPGLHIPEYGASLTSTIYLRGLGSRMENPVMGLYLDGIPVLDKNAYDFDWDGIRSVTFLRGPQGTLYGRNAMGGVLALESAAPSCVRQPRLHLEYGTAHSLRAGGSFGVGDCAFSVSYRHTDGFFPKTFRNRPCDPYDGLSLGGRWERRLSDRRLWLSHSLRAVLSREGGFAYGQWKDGQLHPVSYNDEAGYSRISVIDGTRARLWLDDWTVDAALSLQVLSDDMRMDQDYTPDPVFTLRQRQDSGAGTLECRFRRADEKASWQPLTGVFVLFKRNHMSAPVTFRRDGIERLILHNANSHIPADIGFLSIPDTAFPVDSDFLIGSWNAALFHESVYRTGRWILTAGLRLDYEGGRMDYDCLASLHYRFNPTMKADKPFSVPYSGREGHTGWELLPKLSALFKATDDLSLYATVSKGYRAGGFNTQIFSDILQNETMNAMMKDLGVYLDRPMVSVTAGHTEYAPETAWNGEAGARIRKRDFSAELSAYCISVRNQQLTVFPPGMSTGRMMTNAGESRSVGAEAELDWTPGDFRSHVSWSLCDARFVRYNDGNRDYSGLRVPYVPVHTLYASAGYGIPAGSFRIEADASLRGTGPLWWNEDNTLREPFRLRMDGRLALVFPRWSLYVRGENLTDAAVRTFYFKSVGNEFFALAKPRILLTGISIKL